VTLVIESMITTDLSSVFFNDAGVGKDGAGIAALAMLGARGVAAGTVSHETSRANSPELAPPWEAETTCAPASSGVTLVIESMIAGGAAIGPRHLRSAGGRLSAPIATEEPRPC
jgi:hypothetical protein